MRRSRISSRQLAGLESDLWSPEGSILEAVTSHVEEGSTEGLMERAVRPEVVSLAMKRVRANKGAPGIDGKTVEDLEVLWERHGARICQLLLAGDYVPLPVRRVSIPKPGGGERLLGIPSVMDRVVQQMLLLVLTPIFEPTFSDSSFGFRPGRSAHDAVNAAKALVESGKLWVVDIDLEQFFDRVNHDVLMGRLSKRIADKRVLKLIRRFLRSGVMLSGVVCRTEAGTPQGGPLSPLLANFLLDEVDKALESKNLPFVRYADDCNVYVRSFGEGRRVMDWLTNYLEVKLRLKVNAAKSALALSSERQFPGSYDLAPSWQGVCGGQCESP